MASQFGLLWFALVCSACGNAASSSPTTSSPSSSERPLPASNSLTSGEAGSAGEWTMAAGDYASTRFSTLADIDINNVNQLHEVASFSTGILAGHEAAPIVAAGAMYIATPFPNTLYALDLTRPGAPLKWRYDPDPVAAARGVACCDTVNRGAAFADGRVFITTLDGYVVGVDAAKGEEIWKTKLGDINLGETITMAPLVVKAKCWSATQVESSASGDG